MSTSSQFISVRETSQVLGISEKKVMDLIEERRLQAYRIAEKFLRLKKADVLTLRGSGQVKSENQELPYTSAERISDFLYFNDFYIFSIFLIFVLIYIIAFT